MMQVARVFEQGRKKSYPSLVSLDLLKRLDDMDKITKSVRSRMRR